MSTSQCRHRYENGTRCGKLVTGSGVLGDGKCGHHRGHQDAWGPEENEHHFQHFDKKAVKRGALTEPAGAGRQDRWSAHEEIGLGVPNPELLMKEEALEVAHIGTPGADRIEVCLDGERQGFVVYAEAHDPEDPYNRPGVVLQKRLLPTDTEDPSSLFGVWQWAIGTGEVTIRRPAGWGEGLRDQGFALVEGNLEGITKLELTTDREFSEDQLHLLHLMKWFSNEYWSAGWSENLEYHLWGLLHPREDTGVERKWDEQKVRQLQALQIKAEGWWRIAAADEKPGHEDFIFVAHEDWLNSYEKWASPQGELE